MAIPGIIDIVSEDIFFYLFSSFDLNYEELLPASLTCRSWKFIIESSTVGIKMGEKYNFTLENEPWMKTYLLWIKNAKYFCVLDVSLSMENDDDTTIQRVSRGKWKMLEIAQKVMPISHFIHLGLFADDFVLAPCENMKDVHHFIKEIDENFLEPHSNLTDLLDHIFLSMKGSGKRAHLHIISDFDFLNDPLEALNNNLKKEIIPFKVNLHKMGNSRNGNDYLKERLQKTWRFALINE